jgi:hypothetical protein
MERRSLMKSMILALASGNLPAPAKQPTQAASRSITMIETRDGTKIHFRDWGSGRPIVFVAPWGSAPNGGTAR